MDAVTRLLLVEDDSAIAEPLSRALDREGYTVTRASRGVDALAIAAGPEPIDMVILDLGLPDLDGLEVARRLRKGGLEDRKSTRLNSSHVAISYAVFCLK